MARWKSELWIVLYKIAAVYKQNLENVKYH